jgi:hypothetical protein
VGSPRPVAKDFFAGGSFSVAPVQQRRRRALTATIGGSGGSTSTPLCGGQLSTGHMAQHVTPTTRAGTASKVPKVASTTSAAAGREKSTASGGAST